ncbi:MAG: hypothetical protein JNL71_06155 [Rhodospirillales bacterium]|nr:hypothetical protein [Rhodospirillales bacterium]
MSQAATADLPSHKGLFDLASQGQPASQPARRSLLSATDGGRVEPRLVPVTAATPAPAAPAAPPVRPVAARPQLAVASTNLAPRAPAAAGGSAQVQPKPQAPARRIPDAAEPMSRGRFLKTIEHLAKTEEAKAVGEIVTRVRVREVEQAIQHSARARARYLACVVDLGANRSPVGRANVEELSALRRAHEELSKGMDALADAIREGLVDVVGVGE